MITALPWPLPDRGKLVVFDLEFTSWEGFLGNEFVQPGRYPEIIQIGAICLDLDRDWLELDQFEQIVKPDINPELSDFIVELTGISQAQLDQKARPFDQVLQAFSDYVHGHDAMMAAHGEDSLSLAANCGWRGLQYPLLDVGVINVRPWIRQTLGLEGQIYCSSDLAGIVGFDVAGRGHTAATDCRIIAEVLRRLKP